MSDDLHDRFEDELTRPLAGAAAAEEAEHEGGPRIGRDEWVARHGERRGRAEHAGRIDGPADGLPIQT